MKKMKKELVTKDNIIGDLFEKYPTKASKIIELMISAGLHCVGCGAAMFETIEQGMLVHGHNKKQINDLVNQINKIIKKE